MKTTLADIEKQDRQGRAGLGQLRRTSRDQLIAGAERMGANTLLLNMNVGAMTL